MKSLAILLAILTTACAARPQFAPLQDAESLVGTYCLEHSDVAMQLVLNAGGDYVAYVDPGTRTVARATGAWTYENGELLLGQSDQTSGWHHYMSPIYAKSLGGVVTLTGDFHGSLAKGMGTGCEF